MISPDVQVSPTFLLLDETAKQEQRKEIIASTECLKVSDLTAEPYDTFSINYIFNDTDSNITVYYTTTQDGVQQTESCCIDSGELLEFDWTNYGDLHI